MKFLIGLPTNFMKKFSKILLIVIIVLVILGLVVPLLGLYAAQEEKPNISLENVMESVDQLTELENNKELTPEEKINKEIEIRKIALLNIVILSLSEINDLKEKLESLVLNTDKQMEIKDELIKILDQNKDYAEQLQKELEKDFSLEEIKNLTAAFKKWRSEHYNIDVKNTLSFILIYQEKSVIKTADVRLEKIISDLRKLENTKLIKKEDSWKHLNNAIKNLTNAHLLNNKAENLLLKNFETASSTPIDSINQDLSDQGENDNSSSKDEEKLYDDVKFLVEKSLNEIKNAYKSFLQISSIIKRRLLNL